MRNFDKEFLRAVGRINKLFDGTGTHGTGNRWHQALDAMGERDHLRRFMIPSDKRLQLTVEVLERLDEVLSQWERGCEALRTEAISALQEIEDLMVDEIRIESGRSGVRRFTNGRVEQ